MKTITKIALLASAIYYCPHTTCAENHDNHPVSSQDASINYSDTNQKENEDKCQICLGPLATNQEVGHVVSIFKCIHTFHEQCLATWLKIRTTNHNTATCPICRDDINDTFETNTAKLNDALSAYKIARSLNAQSNSSTGSPESGSSAYGLIEVTSGEEGEDQLSLSPITSYNSIEEFSALHAIIPSPEDQSYHQQQQEIATQEFIRKVLNEELAIDSVDGQGNTALMHAIKLHNAYAARTLLEKTPSTVINQQNRRGETAVLIAAKESNVIMLDLLIEKEADVHISDTHQRNVSDYFSNVAQSIYAGLFYDEEKFLQDFA
jgi:hypothetical protein